MTPLSVKIGRFMCDAAAVDDPRRILPSRSRRHKGRILRDDVIPGNSFSTGDLQVMNCASRKLSLPDFRHWGLGVRGEEEEEELEREEVESPGRDWMDDYSRTLLPHENDRMFHLFGAFRLSDGGKDEAAEEEERVMGDAAAAAEEEKALPWRSSEQMDVLMDDSSKYLLMRDGGDDDLLATPRVKDVALGSDEGPRLLYPDHHHSSSLSSTPSSADPGDGGGFGGGGGLSRPQLSNCHSLSLSHWLSEAESRHSEPFCPQHHHVLDAASKAEPPSIRSSIDRRNGARQVAADCPRDHSSSEGASGAAAAAAVVVIATDDDDDWRLSRHDQVLQWLMSNDLLQDERRLNERGEEEDKEKEEEEAEGHEDPSSSSSASSSSSLDRLHRHQFIISTH